MSVQQATNECHVWEVSAYGYDRTTPEIVTLQCYRI